MFQWPVGLLFMSRLQLLFLNVKFHNAFTCTLANDYPLSDEISDKNGPVRGDCIACDALFRLNAMQDYGAVQPHNYPKSSPLLASLEDICA